MQLHSGTLDSLTFTFNLLAAMLLFLVLYIPKESIPRKLKIIMAI